MPQINATVLISHPSSTRDTCFGWRACVKLRDKGMPVVPTSHPNLSTHNMLAAPQDILLSLRRMLASPSKHKHALFCSANEPMPKVVHVLPANSGLHSSVAFCR